jgi:hypothetical protein
MPARLKLENVQLVYARADDSMEVWEADDHLFDVPVPLRASEPLKEALAVAGLRGYNAGRTAGELAGRCYLQFELRKLLGAD